MTSTVIELEQELRPEPGSAALAFLGGGLALTLLVEADILPANAGLLYVSAAFYVLAGTVWLATKWRSQLGRWVAVFGLATVVVVSIGMLNLPEFALFLPVPLLVAATMLNQTAATLAAWLETTALVVLQFITNAHLDSTLVIFGILAIWVVWGIQTAANSPRRKLLDWFWSHYRQAEHALVEARKDRANLAQTLSDLALANRQLNLLNERLEAMYLVADEAQKSKMTFVAKVSHELRTPLNMIIGLVDVLTETPQVYEQSLPPILFNDLEIVRRNCEHLASMINDILDLSQADAGQFVLQREWVDITSEAQEAIEVVRPLLEKKELTLQADIAHDLPNVYCDRTRIRQVVLNLVSNAARYTIAGGIEIKVRQEKQSVIVSVRDTGPGISPEQAKRIFEPFYRVESGVWRDQTGSGLGLSISKQFIEAHGGHIWLESEPGQGSEFAFRLPIAPPLQPQASGPQQWISDGWVWRERAAWPTIPQLPYQKRIVVCDEIGALTPHLSRFGDDLDFVPVRSVAQTVQALQDCPAHVVIANSPSVVELRSLVSELRSGIPNTPIVGCSFPPPADHAIKAGAERFLIKPIIRADLADALAALSKPIHRVLLIDDATDVQYLLKRMLLSLDETLFVDVASSGAEALDALKRLAPDLMLLDITLPDRDGWQVLKDKRADPAIAAIPTIIISAEDPGRQPLRSDLLIATFGPGLSVTRILESSLTLAAQFLQPGEVVTIPQERVPEH